MPTLAFANFKPGTGKTTSTVWTAFALHYLGHSVLIADTDPAASVLKWSDLAGGFPFHVIGLPSRRVHATLTDYAPTKNTWIICDTPQLEDHADIARSVLRIADHVIVTTAPNPIEIDRMTPVRREVEDLEAVRTTPPTTEVLLNRVIKTAGSAAIWRKALAGDDWNVLRTEIPSIQLYSQSFGLIPDNRPNAYSALAEELIHRDHV
jgi:chromosome partitioning protein